MADSLHGVDMRSPCRNGDRAALGPDDSEARRPYELGNTLAYVTEATAAPARRRLTRISKVAAIVMLSRFQAMPLMKAAW